jgi:metallo-beta-lactamase class B
MLPTLKPRKDYLALLASLFFVLFGLVPNCFAEIIKLSDDVQIEKLQEGVWRHITVSNYPGLGPVPANGLVVANDAGAILVDTGYTPEQTGKILDWIENNLHKKTACVVVTHSHADRMGGITEVMRRHLLTVSSRRTAVLAKAAGLPVPVKTFDEKLDLQLGSEVLIQLEYPGAGHTVDNIVVWLPRQKILFGGCLIKAAKDKSLGYTKDADLSEWPKTVARIETEFPDAEVIIPGHGDIGGRDLLSHTIELLQTARAAVPSSEDRKSR